MKVQLHYKKMLNTSEKVLPHCGISIEMHFHASTISSTTILFWLQLYEHSGTIVFFLSLDYFPNSLLICLFPFQKLILRVDINSEGLSSTFTQFLTNKTFHYSCYSITLLFIVPPLMHLF